MQKIIFISVLALSLVGCEKFKKEREAKEYIKSYVKDPSSVQFRNVSGQCGEFNAKMVMELILDLTDIFIKMETYIFRVLGLKRNTMRHTQMKTYS